MRGHRPLPTALAQTEADSLKRRCSPANSRSVDRKQNSRENEAVGIGEHLPVSQRSQPRSRSRANPPTRPLWLNELTSDRLGGVTSNARQIFQSSTAHAKQGPDLERQLRARRSGRQESSCTGPLVLTKVTAGTYGGRSRIKLAQLFLGLRDVCHPHRYWGPVPPLPRDHPVVHVTAKRQEMSRRSMCLESGLVAINLEQKKSAGCFRVLIKVKRQTPRLRS